MTISSGSFCLQFKSPFQPSDRLLVLVPKEIWAHIAFFLKIQDFVNMLLSSKAFCTFLPQEPEIRTLLYQELSWIQTHIKFNTKIIQESFLITRWIFPLKLQEQLEKDCEDIKALFKQKPSITYTTFFRASRIKQLDRKMGKCRVFRYLESAFWLLLAIFLKRQGFFQENRLIAS